MPTKSVLVTDLDNTLWDWVAIWHEPFSAMLRELVRTSGLAQDVLERDIRLVHQRHGTSEYAFLIEELPCLQHKHPGQNLKQVYEGAIAAFRERRDQVLQPYETVIATLETLRGTGALVIGYTESLAYYTNYRLRKTGIDRLLTVLYSPPDHALPAPPSQLRKYEPEHYQLRTDHRHTPPGELKPNPKLLADILQSVDASPEDAVYVGDSLMKDIAMAQSAGVLDAHAAYGAAQHTEAYEQLRRVTHWSDDDVAKEKATLGAPAHAPTITLQTQLAELLAHVRFERFVPRSARAHVR